MRATSQPILRCEEDTGVRSGTLPYRLQPVATGRQRAVFVAMQMVFLAALLWLSAQILTLLLAQFVTRPTIGPVLAVYCTFVTFWQLTYVYRMLAMKRAVLLDPTVPTGLRIAMATTLVPSREFDLLRDKLEGMMHVDTCGNRIDHWVLDEEDDPRVRVLIGHLNQQYQHRGVHILHFTRKSVERYNETPAGRHFKCFQARQKGGNINAWLDATRDEGYDLITFLDLDHVPQADFYRKVLPYFRDQAVAFVQGPESFRNRDQNFITRAASLERDTFFGLIHRSYFGLGMPVIVGSHTTFRSETFHELGGFYPVHLTEDYLIMLRLRALGNAASTSTKCWRWASSHRPGERFWGSSNAGPRAGSTCCCVTFHACGETTRRRKTSSPSCCSTTTPGALFSRSPRPPCSRCCWAALRCGWKPT